MRLRHAARIAWLALVASGAGAQQLPPDNSLVTFNRYVAVRERNQPGYESKGVPVGPFTLLPSIEAGAEYNDNIFALDTPHTGDVAFRLTPAATLQADGARGTVTLSAQSIIDRYAEQTSENKASVDASAYGVREFGSGTRFRAIARYRSDRESRESQNAFILTARPIKYDTATIGGGVTQKFNNFQIAVETGLTHANYDDGRLPGGAILDQQYRDSDLFRLRARAEIAQSTGLAYFLQATRDQADYRTPSTLGQQRNSVGYEVLSGIRFELPVLARGEIGIGYQKTNYRDDRFRSFAGLALNSTVVFFPTQLTTVTLNAQRSVNDAGTQASSGYVALIVGAQIDHELLRQLIIGANAEFERDSFNGLDRRDRRFVVGATADYRLNRNMSLRVVYDRLDLGSRGFDRYKSFLRDRVTVGLGLKV